MVRKLFTYRQTNKQGRKHNLPNFVGRGNKFFCKEKQNIYGALFIQSTILSVSVNERAGSLVHLVGLHSSRKCSNALLSARFQFVTLFTYTRGVKQESSVSGL